ncbi:isopentenyl-diphosphate Delta-isomerase, partial [Streptomyces sedi]
MSSREAQLVELVDTDGAATGSATVAEAHTPPGRLHRAFSVLLLDEDGRMLVQRRAEVKTRFALRWANACCGHPSPGDTLVEDAERRLAEEIGVRGAALHRAGVYVYRAEDPATGRVEHEYDHVLVGRVPVGTELSPDPEEVADVRWVPPARLRRELADDPEHFAPWFAGVLGVA